MILTWKMTLRLAAILLVALLLQLSFFSFLWIGGTTPALLMVVVVSIGLLGGGVVGAVCGFCAGLLIDSMLLGSLGVTSLVLLVVGYLAGRYREEFHFSGPWVTALVVAVLILIGSLGLGALQTAIGSEADVSPVVLREPFVKAVVAVPLALVCYPLIRRILRPALVEAG